MGQIVQDGAARSSIPRAQMEQLVQGALHGLKRKDAFIQFVQVFLSDPFDAGAAATPVVPQAHQFCNGIQTKSHVTRTADKTQGVDIFQRVLAVVAVGA